jgi:NAD kinase
MLATSIPTLGGEPKFFEAVYGLRKKRRRPVIRLSSTWDNGTFFGWSNLSELHIAKDKDNDDRKNDERHEVGSSRASSMRRWMETSEESATNPRFGEVRSIWRSISQRHSLSVRVLVVHKRTNFELHGERVEQNIRKGGLLKKANLERLKKAHEQHYGSLERLKSFLAGCGANYVVIAREADWPVADFDLYLTLGGDGTLLSVARHLEADKKIVGFRSSDASVGYTCVGSVEQELVESVLKDEYPWISVSRIHVYLKEVHTGESHFLPPALNDVLYCNANPAATTRYKISLDGAAESQKSSGVWVSTGVGSTAGIKAAGGGELPFDSRQFQFKVRELYHAPGERFNHAGQTFDPDQISLKIENRCEKAVIALDGQHCMYPMDFGDQLCIKRGPNLYIAAPSLIGIGRT